MFLTWLLYSYSFPAFLPQPLPHDLLPIIQNIIYTWLLVSLYVCVLHSIVTAHFQSHHITDARAHHYSIILTFFPKSTTAPSEIFHPLTFFSSRPCYYTLYTILGVFFLLPPIKEDEDATSNGRLLF